MQITETSLDHVFSYHKPTETQAEAYVRIREEAKGLARTLLLLCPKSRELSMALTHVQEAVMCANAAIAINTAEQPQTADQQVDR